MENKKGSKVRISFLKNGFGRRESTLFLVALIILVAFTLRWLWIPTKDTITHDEAISYLAATCHEGSFSAIENSAVPVKASEWKNNLKVDEKFCFPQIRNDLVSTDRHPPLYFWVLHAWALLVGVQAWTGPALNTFIALITLALLYSFATDVLKSRKDGLIVTFTYGLSLAVVGISFVARMYDLLTLIVLLFVWIVFRLTDPDRPLDRVALSALVIISAIGMLTHFFFLVAISAAICFAIIRLARKDVRRALTVVALILLGLLLARLVYPFEDIILRDASQLGPSYTLEEFGQRLVIVLFSFYQFTPLIVMAIIAMAVVGWWYIRKDHLSNWASVRSMDRSGIGILFFLIWLGLGIIGLYLAFILPRQVMGESRLSMVWPFLAFGPVFILRIFNYRGTILLFFILLPLLFGSIFIQRTRAYPEQDPGSILQGSSLIIIDNPARGMISQILWLTPDDANVIIGNQEFLLENAGQWLDFLEETTLYISDISYSSTEEGREGMLSLMEQAGFEPVSIGRLPTQKPPLRAVVYELRPDE